MRRDLLQLAAALSTSGEPFVMAVVVRREPASSAQVGNMALIMGDGTFHGWLGGSCIQPALVREALSALADGSPRLIALSPEPNSAQRSGVSVFPMTCHSGGSVDIYIEPVLPAPRLLVFGLSPTAQVLVRLGKAMEYAVDVIDPEAGEATFPEADRVMVDVPPDAANRPAFEKARTFVVVATQGRRDEEAITAALALEPAYLGVVASRRRYAEIRDTLLAGGVAPSSLDRIRNPAGLDLGAKAPEEVALSIFAEIVQVRRAGAGTHPAETAAPPIAQEEIDPVCGMTVVVATARHRAEHGGRTFYFCCGGCRQKFLASPERYGVVSTTLSDHVRP